MTEKRGRQTGFLRRWFRSYRRKRRDNPRAFTLVEALVAMTVMAVGVTGILGSFTAALVGGAIAEDYALASLKMEQLLTQIRAGSITPYDVNMGIFSDDARYQWVASFTELDVNSLYQVEITITWERAGKDHSLKVTTCQYCDPNALPVVM